MCCGDFLIEKHTKPSLVVSLNFISKSHPEDTQPESTVWKSLIYRRAGKPPALPPSHLKVELISSMDSRLKHEHCHGESSSKKAAFPFTKGGKYKSHHSVPYST